MLKLLSSLWFRGQGQFFFHFFGRGCRCFGEKKKLVLFFFLFLGPTFFFPKAWMVNFVSSYLLGGTPIGLLSRPPRGGVFFGAGFFAGNGYILFSQRGGTDLYRHAPHDRDPVMFLVIFEVSEKCLLGKTFVYGGLCLLTYPLFIFCLLILTQAALIGIKTYWILCFYRVFFFKIPPHWDKKFFKSRGFKIKGWAQRVFRGF